MTQRHEREWNRDGPYLLVACLCENVVQRADGVLTLVNIVDRLNITSRGPNAPVEMPPTIWRTNLIVVLKAGSARGRRELRVVPENPDFTTRPPVVFSVNLEGEADRGIQVVMPMELPINVEGLHWVNLHLLDRDDEKLLSKLPLRVTYTRITSPLPERPPQQP